MTKLLFVFPTVTHSGNELFSSIGELATVIGKH